MQFDAKICYIMQCNLRKILVQQWTMGSKKFEGKKIEID
jgi:hypothetical protein